MDLPAAPSRASRLLEKHRAGVRARARRADLPRGRTREPFRGRHKFSSRARLGTYGAKSDNQIGLAGPGNIATGNLNIFSHRPAVGAYEAILPTSIVWCEHREFFEIARRNPDLFMLLATQCELSMLSDRLAFACLTLLNSEQAMKVVLLSWTSHFGHLEGDEVIAPRVLTRSIIRSVLGCSMGWVDRLAAEWRRNDVRRVEGGIVHYRLDILQEANEILCDLEEKVSGLPRPRDVRRYWRPS